MELEKVREMIDNKLQTGEYEREDLALYCPAEDAKKLVSQMNTFTRGRGVGDIDIITDCYIDEPQVLPKEVEFIEGAVLEDPPEDIARQILQIDSEKTSNIMRQVAYYTDQFIYELDSVEYRFDVAAIEKYANLDTLEEIENNEEFEFVRESKGILVYRKQPEKEYVQIPVEFKIADSNEGLSTIEDKIDYTDIEGRIAEKAVTSAGGERREAITEFVRYADEKSADESLDNETNKREAVIGERIVNLGGMRIEKDLPNPDAIAESDGVLQL